MDKKDVIHLHDGILLHGSKIEGTLTLCDSMDGPQDYYTKQKKPVRKRQLTYNLTSM